MGSLYEFFQEQAKLEKQAKADVPQTKEFDEDFKRISAINDEWNKTIAASREVRVAKQDADRREEILQKLIAAEERRGRRKAAIDALVRQEKVNIE